MIMHKFLQGTISKACKTWRETKLSQRYFHKCGDGIAGRHCSAQVIWSQEFPIGEERGDRTVWRERGPGRKNPAFSLVLRTGRRDLEMRQSQSSISGDPDRPCVWISGHLLLVVHEFLATQNREF
jgi:hypothetical protein